MKKNLPLILISFLLSSCAATVIGVAAGTGAAIGTDDRGGSTVFDDQSLSNKAKSIAEAIEPKGSYTVSAYNGQILLAGQVPNQYDKDVIYSSVKNMNNINGVWNYLTVEKNQSLGQITTDTYLTSAAKSRLIAQKNINTNNIKVVTCNGVVYLMGSDIGSNYQLSSAITGIRGIEGVKDVVNLTNRWVFGEG